MQARLVDLTEENNTYQKSIRRHQTWPELKIKAQLNTSILGPNENQGELILTPKVNPLIVIEVLISTTARIDYDLLLDHYLDRIIEVNTDFVISFRFKNKADFSDGEITLLLSDIDRTSDYEQKLKYQGQLFKISASKPLKAGS